MESFVDSLSAGAGREEDERRVSSNTEASGAASGRGGSVCKLLPDEHLNRGGGLKAPRAK